MSTVKEKKQALETSDSKNHRKSVNLPLAYVGESNCSKTLRKQNNKIIASSKGRWFSK